MIILQRRKFTDACSPAGTKFDVMCGDMTPYWEDGATSSARETGINRLTADRLAQAETIWALRNPGKFPVEEFAAAWKNAAMYSEHTWVTRDAPLMQLGGLTANLPGIQSDPNAYLKTIQPSSRIYSWVMNSHWHTNYRTDQEGATWFRYFLRPHRGYDPVAATRFGIVPLTP